MFERDSSLSGVEATGIAGFRLLLPEENWKWFVVRGVLAIALGIAAIIFPLGAVVAFTMLFAGYSFVDGVVSIATGVSSARESKDRWVALILRGVVGVLVALLFVSMPLVATFTYAMFSLALVAVWAVLSGLLEIRAAILLRKRIKGEWLLGLSGALSVLLGLAVPVFILMDPVATIVSVAWIIGGYATIAGVALALLGFRLRTHANPKLPSR
ncbi:MAG: hypothetical protein NVS3B5_02830 [Sphingomicrobium sp.]